VKRTLVAATVLAVIAGVLIFAWMPPARLILPAAADDGTIAGVLHVHTNRSDGRGTPDEVAAAAARAGMKFIVFTDHGDGTRHPDPPTYRAGVLCLDGVEISTSAGHYIAIGMAAAPYPLGGEPRDVVEDVRRLGGLGIAAHPDSPKPELSWGDWDAPIDGMELINLDTGWRVRVRERGVAPKLDVLAAFGTYPFRPGETIAGLLNEPSAIIERWQALSARRPVTGIAGVDAHAKLALWNVEPGDNRFTLPFPGYEAAFRTLSVHVRPDRPLSGDAVSDADTVLRSIRDGHLYTAIDAIATPASFEFSARHHLGDVHQGGRVTPAASLTLRVRSNAPPDFTTTVWKGNQVLTTGRHRELAVPVPPEAAVYRVEIRASGRPGQPPWIISNPIYVGASEPERSDAARPPGAPVGPSAPTVSGPVLFPADAFGWTVEHDPASRADLDVEGGEMRLRFSLGADPATKSWVAIAAPPQALAPHDRVTVRRKSGGSGRSTSIAESVRSRSASTT
jgi:hypothetical protein